ncbi:MAG: CHASE domain-containing protein [Rhodospirillaceae bacterium]
MVKRWLPTPIKSLAIQVIPAFVLVVGLSIAYNLGESQREAAFSSLKQEFEIRSQEIYSRINERLGNYGLVLRGGAGLFASNKEVGRDEWHKYIESLNLDKTLPGTEGVGFSRLIKPEEMPAHIEAIKHEGFPGYNIRPPGQRDLYTSITYLEPFTGRNLRAFGFDMFSEPVRRAAMSAACTDDKITMSGKVTLVQEDESDIQSGFLMYHPVYRSNSSTITAKERWNNLTGWVYSPFRMNDFMKDIVGDGVTLNGIYLDVMIFDGDEVNQDGIMYHYDNDIDPVITHKKEPTFISKKKLVFGDHYWTVIVHSQYQFDKSFFEGKVILLEASGAAISLLIAFISWLLVSGAIIQRSSLLESADLNPGQSFVVQSRRPLAIPYILATVLTLTAGILLIKTDEAERQTQKQAERVDVENILNVIRLRLERALTAPMIRTRGMAAQIVAHGDVSLDVFNKVAEVLLRGYSAVRNISVSHGTKIDLMYPLAGNESVVGIDLANIATHAGTVKRAIETRTPVVHGPINLMQGGSGLIVREPVFLPDEGGRTSHLFGLVSIVLDTQQIYDEAGLDRDGLRIQLAIRGRDGLGHKGDMIRGDPKIFSEQPVELDVEFPHGTWRLAAIPKNGWGGTTPMLSVSRFLGGGLFLLIALISFSTAHHLIDRRRMLQQVSSSEERFRNLLRIASDGVHLLDEEGNLVMCSDSFLDMLGYSEDEARTLSVGDWDVVFSREDLLPRIKELIKVPAIFETRHRRRDGSEFDAEINACGIDLGGRPYLYASSRNISERKSHDKELRQAKIDAENAAKAKSEFLATMSHEIRTPITSVMGTADLLQQTPLTEEQSGYLRILKSATRTLLTVLNDILDLSKIEAGKVAIETVVFPLRESVQEVVDVGQTGATAKGLHLELVISDDVPALVVGDPIRVQQILFNLMSNAIKFTERGTVSIRLQVNKKTDRGAKIIFEIEDTGIGISRDKIDQLFSAFTQAEQGTTRRFGGTGLGLAISKKLVELMGGRIGVESEPKIGTLFWFSLTFEIVTRSEVERPTLPDIEQFARRFDILLAEDNRINQLLVVSMLSKSGHTVTAVANGREALNAVAAKDYDIVLMDMQMPVMDGEEATLAIRALPFPKNKIPILALTADVLTENRVRYLQVGVNDVVPKPIDWQVLSKALNLHCTETVAG